MLLENVVVDLSECLLYLLRIEVLYLCGGEPPALHTLIVVMVDYLAHFRVQVELKDVKTVARQLLIEKVVLVAL